MKGRRGGGDRQRLHQTNKNVVQRRINEHSTLQLSPAVAVCLELVLVLGCTQADGPFHHTAQAPPGRVGPTNQPTVSPQHTRCSVGSVACA